MRHGFVKVGAGTPEIRVGDVDFNTESIKKIIDEAVANKVRILALPELCITGYTCGDLFLQELLLESAKAKMLELAAYIKDKNILVLVSLPYCHNSKLYNCGAVLYDGKVLGIIPKSNLPNYSEFYEARHFATGNTQVEDIEIGGYSVPFGTNILFCEESIPEMVIAVEICEDLWVPLSPSITHALAGATVVLNASASDEYTGKDQYRRDLVKLQSAKCICAYIYADAGEGESTTDLIYGGHNIICENGIVLKESPRFTAGLACTEVDLKRIYGERRRMTTYLEGPIQEKHRKVYFSLKSSKKEETQLSRSFDKTPFVPYHTDDRNKRCYEILSIQAVGLKKRIQHTGVKNVVIGISGGLDSTLALLVIVKTFDLLGLDRSGIIAVTMPCFGTTDRTYKNACTLVNSLGATLLEIPITEAVLVHLRDIDHDVNQHNVTYENAQARERTQVLMDLANKYNGFVVGTGDMSELALGWATYNGDHMSMYGVNSSVPKTLVRYLVSYYADNSKDTTLKEVLFDILDTPVSPELLPPKDGEIAQKTEDLVGPYELHDFFLYYAIRYGFQPSKIFRIAARAFQYDYTEEVILKWLKTFYRRFFAQQYKRSCLPDGPKVGSVAISPRGDLRMPSDASSALWLKDLDTIQLEKPNKKK